MRMRANTFLKIAVGGACLALFACGKKEAASPPPPVPVISQPAAPTTVEAPKEKQVYVYAGDRFRDPFVPAGFSGGYSVDAVFDPAKSSVRGIIYGPGQKTAVLATGAGNTYFVKSGKIYDVMGKVVEGYTAKVFPDKVVVSNGAENEFELKIRTDEEKGS